ncbi:hypothetical protein BDV32DRAFT_148800 [Aspergillus pseudonomiae]|uniref:Uncharacterized protein n=1 Tax=Aspergillus pseudonomiae TaxID=1506151 RepID=A0A5N6I7Y7_9EURO|nr:uncharacterized protein BDV37DRAFT_284942 [Aspergillus pseudonomiae]KAB8261243.1 hypothetical protein BDV32DRAFT_148800 [Aspergillus pseudonomiae]KAE8402129.1 hypothetical protein BDV37DRAFT_284942 [Aspergillus pseudonomiae]
MKFSFLSLLSVAASVAVAAPTEAAKDRNVPFNNRALGPLKPNPFQGLKYEGAWQVGRYSVQASNVKTTNRNKLLFYPMTNITDVNVRGYVSVDGGKDKFNGKSVKLGCSVKKGSKKQTVPCEIQITGATLASQKYVSVQYTNTNALQTVDLDDLYLVDSLFFRIKSAGKDKELTENITLLLDDFQYAIEAR